MRADCISDEMWHLYNTHILSPKDPRLLTEPFEQHVHFIVHRHKIRVMRSLENAQTESKLRQVPLFMVQAGD